MCAHVPVPARACAAAHECVRAGAACVCARARGRALVCLWGGLVCVREGWVEGCGVHIYLYMHIYIYISVYMCHTLVCARAHMLVCGADVCAHER